jgi:hypothetical protein
MDYNNNSLILSFNFFIWFTIVFLIFFSFYIALININEFDYLFCVAFNYVIVIKKKKLIQVELFFIL